MATSSIGQGPFDNNGVIHHSAERNSEKPRYPLTNHDNLVNSGQWDVQGNVVVMDFAKAFNKAPYQHLFSKLHHYGIQGTTLD